MALKFGRFQAEDIFTSNITRQLKIKNADLVIAPRASSIRLAGLVRKKVLHRGIAVSKSS